MESEFPSNSKRPTVNVKKTEEKKIEQITTGEVIQRKKSLGRRFAETFTGADSKSVIDYVFFDVALPAFKAMIADMVTQGTERKLYGSVRSTSRNGNFRSNNGHTAYNRISQSPIADTFRSGNRREDPRAPSRRARATHNFDEIILATRAEAIEVIDRLFSVVSQYDVATVADLYEMVGITASYTDDKWGWTDLRGADVTRTRNGYLLDLPRPEPID